MDYEGLLADLGDMALNAFRAAYGRNGFFVSQGQEMKALAFAVAVIDFYDEIRQRVN